MAKRRRRLTIGKKKSARKVQKTTAMQDVFSSELYSWSGRDDRDRKPTETEWNTTMERCGSFELNGFVFHKGDDAIVHSAEGDDNVWVVRIKGIRRRTLADGHKKSWVHIQWYYSNRDIAELVPSFDTACMPTNERTISDREDLLSCSVFKMPMYVHEWIESDPNPPQLTDKMYFQRFSLSWVHSRFDYIPVSSICLETCGRVYNPFSLYPEYSNRERELFYDSDYTSRPHELGLLTDTMHFCPRPDCGRWFHRACLLHARSCEKEDAFVPGSRPLRLLAVDPDQNSDVVHPLLKRYTFARSQSGKMSSADLRAYCLRENLEKVLRKDIDVPEELVEVAGQPIVRYPNAGTFSTAGNVTDVIFARRLLYQAFDGDQFDFEDMVANMEREYGADWVNKDEAYQEAWHFLISQNMLACPLPSYWKKVKETVPFPDGPPPLICPQCEGAI